MLHAVMNSQSGTHVLLNMYSAFLSWQFYTKDMQQGIQ